MRREPDDSSWLAPVRELPGDVFANAAALSAIRDRLRAGLDREGDPERKRPGIDSPDLAESRAELRKLKQACQSVKHSFEALNSRATDALINATCDNFNEMIFHVNSVLDSKCLDRALGRLKSNSGNLGELRSRSLRRAIHDLVDLYCRCHGTAPPYRDKRAAKVNRPAALDFAVACIEAWGYQLKAAQREHRTLVAALRNNT